MLNKFDIEMTEWFYRMASRRRKKKDSDDNFWCDFLKRSKSDQKVNKVSHCRNLNVRFDFSLNEATTRDKSNQNVMSDKTEYQKHIFNKIFYKKFETITVNSMKKIPNCYSTYHFCQK